MNKIIEELLKNGIPVSMEYNKNNGCINYIIDGFYKSGTVSLEENGENLIATSRYDEKTNITEFRDIVLLNYNWWTSSKNRSDIWKSPDSMWLPFLLKEGFVKETIETVKKYS